MIRSLRRRHRWFAWLLLVGGLAALGASLLVRPAPLGPGPIAADQGAR